MVNSTRDDWDEKVPYAVFAYNSTVHATTGCTPNLLIFGEEALMPPDIVYRVPSSTLNPPCPVFFLENIRENLREGYEIARETSARSAEYQKRRYDTKLKERGFNPFRTKPSHEKVCQGLRFFNEVCVRDEAFLSFDKFCT